jgi:thiol-disulfide isomerase/thioredoxin
MLSVQSIIKLLFLPGIIAVGFEYPAIQSAKSPDPLSYLMGRPDSLKVGDQAPMFVMRDIMTGEAVYLRDYTGKELRNDLKKNKTRHAVVLSFWATWCQPCKEEIPQLTKVALGFKGMPVKFFLVNTLDLATEDSIKAVMNDRGYDLPCLVDASGRFGRMYSVKKTLPVLVVLDKYGVVRDFEHGYHPNFSAPLTNLLEKLAKE